MNASPKRFAIYSDEELMSFIQSGRVEAFDELYERYSKPLMIYFCRMLNFDRTLAEDALQDLFLKIAENPARFDKKRSFKTWVFSVASNYCKNFYRHKQVVSNNHESLVYELDNSEDTLYEVISKMDKQKFLKTLEEVLNDLPFEKKEAFVLKYQEDKSLAEIALIQECSEGTVKSRLHYTVKLLEEKLKIFKPELQNGNAK